MKLLLVAMGLVMIVPTFTSCKDDEEDAIIGIWKYSEDGYYETFCFNADGKFVFIEEYYEGMWERYDEMGTYIIEGSNIILYWNENPGDNDKISYSISNNILYLDGDPYYRQ